MRSYRKELWFEVPRRRAFINITDEVETCLRESGIKEGFCLVNAMHITASVFINDDESGLFTILSNFNPRSISKSLFSMILAIWWSFSSALGPFASRHSFC